MRFSVFLPPQALAGERVPALYYLAGLTCTEETPADQGGRSAWRPSSASRSSRATRARARRPTPATTRTGTSASARASTSTRPRRPWSASYRMETHVTRELVSCGRGGVPDRARSTRDLRPLDGRARRAHARAAHPALRERRALRADRRAERGAVGREGLRGLPRRRPGALGRARHLRARARTGPGARTSSSSSIRAERQVPRA
jgi:hypothetical protein